MFYGSKIHSSSVFGKLRLLHSHQILIKLSIFKNTPLFPLLDHYSKHHGKQIVFRQACYNSPWSYASPTTFAHDCKLANFNGRFVIKKFIKLLNCIFKSKSENISKKPWARVLKHIYLHYKCTLFT